MLYKYAALYSTYYVTATLASSCEDKGILMFRGAVFTQVNPKVCLSEPVYSLIWFYIGRQQISRLFLIYCYMYRKEGIPLAANREPTNSYVQ